MESIRLWVATHRKLAAQVLALAVAAVAEFGFDARWAAMLALLGGLVGIERAPNDVSPGQGEPETR